MPIVGQFGSLAGLGSLILPGGAMESIATVTISGTSTYYATFTSIPGGYQHLQIRGIGRGATSTDYASYLAFNSDRGSNYARHDLEGTGASAFANATTSTDGSHAGRIAPSGASASIFGGMVIDILDYASTSKFKTVRSFSGYDSNGGGNLAVASGLWRSTSAITQIDLFAGAVNWADKTTFALYGLRAP